MYNDIIIVSGLPRSGTSLMMQMLQAGGLEIASDSLRKADDSNPKGYFELNNVRNIKHDTSWFIELPGKAVKIVSPLLRYIPDKFNYKIIFMLRHLDEIIASQRHMLLRNGKSSSDEQDKHLRQYYEVHLAEIKYYLQHSKSRLLYIDYHHTLINTQDISESLSNFLDLSLNINNMTRVVDQRLYRERKNNIAS